MQRILITALIAGFIAGIVGFGLQLAKLSPMILQAEVYEEAAASHEAEHEHNSSGHQHEDKAWQPANGIERSSYSLLAYIGVGVGYALMLLGAITANGTKANLQTGVLWGISGFFVFSLAPAFGMAPILPGSMEADLYARQMWWLQTVIATAAGLYLIVFAKANPLKILGISLLAAPHIIGAPQAVLGGSVPPELNAQFAAASLGVSAIFWLVLGAASGWLYGKQAAS